MAIITEKIRIEADNTDANRKIRQTSKELDKTAKEGMLSAGKLSKEWAQTFVSFGLGAAAAGKALQAAMKLAGRAMEILDVKTQGSISRMGQAWDQMTDAFLIQMMPGGSIDGLTKFADEMERSGPPAARLVSEMHKLTMTRGPIGAVAESMVRLAKGLWDGKDAIDAITQTTGGGEMIVEGLTIDVNKVRKEMAAERSKSFADRSKALVAGRSMSELMAGPQPGGIQQDFDAAFAAREAARQRYAASAIRIEENKNKRIAEIERQSNQMLLDAQAQDQQERAQMIMATVSTVGFAFQGFFDDMVQGSDDAGKQFVINMLKNIGQMVFSKGVADMAAAVANGLIYGNFTGIGAASAEMALGTTLMAGGSVLGKGKGGGGMGGAGGGFVGGGSRPASGDGQDRTLIINVSGAVTDAGVGVAIRDALNKAGQQGLI